MVRERVQEKELFMLYPPSSGLGHQLVNNSQPADLALRKATPIAHSGGPIILPFISCKISHLLFPTYRSLSPWTSTQVDT